MNKIKIISLVVAAVMLLASCGIRKAGVENTKKDNETTQPPRTTESTPEAVTTGGDTPEADTTGTPLSVPSAGLYNMVYSDAGVREDYELVATFEDDMSQGRDLCVLGGFPSNSAALSGKNMGDIWDACVRENSLSTDVRPGYLLEFDTPEGKCEKLILRPSDITEDYWDYIETYIYDDIHQTPGAWYSHLLEEEFTDETIVTSVKLTAGEKIGDVRSLALTVFLYEAGDRDSVDTGYARQKGYTAEIIPNKSR